MSVDLFQNEAVGRLSNLPPVQTPAPSTFQGFLSGTGAYAMRSLASTARAIDLAGAVGPIIKDAFTGGTVAQDRYFKEHDEVFNRAVDYWTPRSNEVGTAGQVVGQLLGTLPVAIGAPAFAVMGAGFGSAEETVKAGATPDQAIGVGMVQGATAGLGMWLPILGTNGWQRVVVGGALGNAAMGAAGRGASGAILEGTPLADQYRAFDPSALTLDVLMGAAFGTMAHLSPAQRAQGAEAWKSIGEWAQGLRPAEKDSIAALRMGQHLNEDSAPGKLETPQAIDAHTRRIRTAVDQLLRDEPVSLSDLPFPRTTPDEARVADALNRVATLRAAANDFSAELGLPRSTPTESELASLARDRLVSTVSPDLIAQIGAGEIPQILELHTAIADLEQRISAAETGRATAERELTRQHQDSGMQFKAAREQARRDLDNQAADLQSTRQRLTQQLEAAQRAEHARQDLDALEAGRIPDRLQATMDRILGEAQRGFRPTPIAETVRSALAELARRNEQPVHAMGARTEAQQGEAALPSPPPSAAMPAGASAQRGALAQEAQRAVDARPDATITVGRNVDGTSITVTARQFLADAMADVQRAREDASLFEVAATCMLGKL